VQLAVTATRPAAIVSTFVVVVGVAIITGFITGLTKLDITSSNAITASGDAAGQQAAIVVVDVAVITSFIPNLLTNASVAGLIRRAQGVGLVAFGARTNRQVEPRNPVTAERLNAIGSAIIKMVGVAVITFFIAGHAGIDVVSNDAVTAMSNPAITKAAVVVKVIAVVAFFAEVQNAIAAHGWLAGANRRTSVTITAVSVIALFALV
jgi:hypothetical protein